MEAFNSFANSFKEGFGSLEELEKVILKRKDQPYMKDVLSLLNEGKKSFDKKMDLDKVNKLYKKAEGIINNITNDNNRRDK